MTNKIEISRELAERLTKYYPSEIADQETMQAIRIEALAALDELRALLVAPAVERQEPVGFRYRANGDWELMEESPFADGRMKPQYKTTKTSTQRLVKALERVIDLFPYVTYVNMETDEDVVKARKLIESLRVKS